MLQYISILRFHFNVSKDEKNHSIIENVVLFALSLEEDVMFESPINAFDFC